MSDGPYVAWTLRLPSIDNRIPLLTMLQDISDVFLQGFFRISWAIVGNIWSFGGFPIIFNLQSTTFYLRLTHWCVKGVVSSFLAIEHIGSDKNFCI